MTWSHHERSQTDSDTAAPCKAWMDQQPNYKLLSKTLAETLKTALIRSVKRRNCKKYYTKDYP